MFLFFLLCMFQFYYSMAKVGSVGGICCFKFLGLYHLVGVAEVAGVIKGRWDHDTR